jgi:hypothetical protein
MTTEFDTTALERVLNPLASSLDRAGLESLVRFRADQQTQDRVDELAEKCNAGTLSAAEEREYDSYVETSRFIAVLKAEARRILDSLDAA